MSDNRLIPSLTVSLYYHFIFTLFLPCFFAVFSPFSFAIQLPFFDGFSTFAFWFYSRFNAVFTMRLLLCFYVVFTSFPNQKTAIPLSTFSRCFSSPGIEPKTGTFATSKGSILAPLPRYSSTFKNMFSTWLSAFSEGV